MALSKLFSDAATTVAEAAGRPMTFALCCAAIVVWAVTGPLFGFSDTWQLVINTGTTIITFLMVFLIQNTQNRHSAAIQAKLDELIRASAARNLFIGIEHLTPEELEKIRAECEKRAQAEEAADRDDGVTSIADSAVARANERARQAADDAA
jgi:low affinity Fe/Cu permease